MHSCIRAAIRPGVTTLELDRIGRDVIERRGARSNFLGYGHPPFSGVICASPNDVIVHGVPGPVRLEDGDIVSIDCGAIIEGWHGDAAFTAGVGEISADDLRLIEATEASLAAGIAAMQPGGRLSDIGAAVQQVAETAGFSVVREYTGHGIGLAMHEQPDVPNWGKPGKGRKLGPGQTYAVEPMVCAGRPDTRLLDDQWTVVTRDGRRAAHTEHTIAITDHGPEILTLP
jgi:methionyl aminopeptidase